MGLATCHENEAEAANCCTCIFICKAHQVVNVPAHAHCALQVGRMLDSVYRPLGLGAMLLVQDVSILLSSVALAVAAAGGGGAPLAASPLFVVLVVLAMTEKLTSISSELAIERDWVTQLAGGAGAWHVRAGWALGQAACSAGCGRVQGTGCAAERTIGIG